MSLKQRIEADIKSAMLAKKQDELRALRGIKSMIMLAETEKGSTGELNEEAEVKVLMKAAKQREDSARIYQDQGRADLLEKETQELEVIRRYLPEMMSEEEVTARVQAIVEEMGASGPQDMGKVMGRAMKEFSGKADGKLVSGVVKNLLIG